MNTASRFAAAAGALLLLGGCVSMPSGPGAMVLPGTGKNFDQFRADDMDCRQFATSQVGGNTPDQAAESSAVKSAAIGALIGAAAGAIAGGNNSTASGAAAGLIIGSMAGAAAAGSSQYTLQQRYDHGYQQCMYARGHKIPSSARYGNSSAQRPIASAYPPPPPTAGAIPPPPTAGAIPPPPPGAPPPPPPGVK